MRLKNNPFLRFWFTPYFPKIHYGDNVGLVKKWFINPLKRWTAKFYLILLRMLTDIKVIGITGSAGKTTTKEMLASILKLKGKTVYSKANIDPIYNIPNTILRTVLGTKYLILEMGVEYPGEMDYYLWLAKPDIGVITNIFPTHLEFFEDENGVLKEKSKLVTGLGKDQCAVLNKNDYRLEKLGNKLKCKVLWFEGNDDPRKQNGNCAVKIAEYLNVNKEVITKGVAEHQPPPHRLIWLTLKNGCLLLDDSYNSNPKAVESAIKIFLKKSGKRKKVAVMGDMLELGEYEKQAHRKIGRKLAEARFDVVIGVGKASEFIVQEIGKMSSDIKTYFVASGGDVMSILKPLLSENTAVLIKGSHSIGLYKIVEQLS